MEPKSSAGSQKIAVIEDEPDILDIIVFNLNREGFSVVATPHGNEGFDLISRESPDLVVLDLMLPGCPGIEVLRKVRNEPRTAAVPVLILTAKGEEVDRVVGFELGADDYMVKPVSMRELVLRVRAILRRGRASMPGETSRSVQFGPITIEPDAYRVAVDGHEVPLTALEFRLLTTLLERRDRVQTRERLLDDVWGIEADVFTRTVDTHVKRLRQKLGPAGDYIETVRGVGYRFRGTPESH
jgi:two-component system phosphate regulon response regulator PhoB